MNADVEKAVEFEALLADAGATFKDCLIVGQQNVMDAVNEAIDAAMRELRTHKSDLPGWAAAMDFAIAVVAKHKVSK